MKTTAFIIKNLNIHGSDCFFSGMMTIPQSAVMLAPGVAGTHPTYSPREKAKLFASEYEALDFARRELFTDEKVFLVERV